MIGLAVGLACGALEFFLLAKTTAAIVSGTSKKAIFYVLAKIIILGIVLFGGVLLFRDQLVQLGIGIAVPLVVGSILSFAMNIAKTSKKKDNVAADGESAKEETKKCDVI